MMSPTQLTANRANAQLSTGPTTQAGKQTVSQNAVKHGLSGRVQAALPGEHDAFDRHCRALSDALSPVGVIEEELAQDIAADRWRLKRARAIENAIFAQIEREQSGELDPAAAHAQAWVDPSTGLQRLALYVNRIQRAIEKNAARLEALQTGRKAAFSIAQQQAILLTQLAESKGETYDSAPDFPPTPEAASSFGGFVYSVPEIARILNRASRLEEAKFRLESPTAEPPQARTAAMM